MKHKSIKTFTFRDIFVYGVIIALSLILLPRSSPSGEREVEVRIANQLKATLPLAKDTQFHLTGTDGEVHVEIKNQQVLVTEAGCKKQICVHTAPISKPGHSIICVPNHMSIMITAKKSSDQYIDATSY